MEDYQGYCPICETDVTFHVEGPWYRDQLFCPSCTNGSVPRERALALVLNELCPNWREKRIHESSAVGRGISVKLAQQCYNYVGTQYFPEIERGTTIDGWRNEDLEEQTFPNGVFDIVISLDVMEHVYFPDKVLKEIHRTLASDGVYICTFPIRKSQVDGWERRFELLPDGTRHDIKEPEIHGNPVSIEGSIVTIDWGYDLHQTIAAWAPFDVRVYRFADQTHGILGEYTEVVACRKRTLALARC